VTPQSGNQVSTSLGNSGLCWTVFARTRDTAVPAEGNGDLQTLICVLVARPRRCLTLSNPVPWQNWMVAYLGYTLRMRTLFRGWPIMVNDTHTRRRRYWSPAHINVGYLRVKVDRYIGLPNPLRCFKCQKFGHSSRLCRNDAVCHRCGGKHTEENCNNAAKCINCSGPHGASSRECPVWLREKEVQRVKAEKNISFPEARQIVTQQQSTLFRSEPTSAAV